MNDEDTSQHGYTSTNQNLREVTSLETFLFNPSLVNYLYVKIK